MAKKKGYKKPETNSDNTERDSEMSEDTRRGTTKGRKPSRKGKGRSGAESQSRGGNFNDPAWYITSPEMLNDVASFPFSDRLGVPIKFSPYDGDPNSYGKDYDMPQPGICSIDVMPYIGNTIPDSQAPINLAGQMVYQEMRKANSGSINYDWPNVIKYFLVMDNCYMLWAFLRRIYGTARIYQYRNSYVPERVLTSMGVDPKAVLGMLPQLKWILDVLAKKLQNKPVPAIMSYFLRHIWLFDKIWVDGLTSKSQMYLFNPKYLYYYDDTETPTVLRAYSVMNQLSSAHTPTDLLDEITNLVENFTGMLPNNSDISVIGGDILKAYGPSNCFIIPETPIEYTTEIVYSEEVLRQIHNLTIVNIDESSADENNMCITEDVTTNNLYQNIHLSSEATKHTAAEWMINLDLDNVQPAEFLVSTRLTSLCVPNTTELIGGDTLVVQLRIYQSAKDGMIMADPLVIDQNMIKGVTNTVDGGLFKFMSIVAAASNFRYFPLIYLEHKGSSTNNHPDMRGMIGDLNNFTIIDHRELLRLHQAAFMGLFGVPDGIYASRSRYTSDPR